MKNAYLEESLETCVIGSYDWIVILEEEPVVFLNVRLLGT
jgi:hypothetical protein